MAKQDLGKKRRCASCGMKFYDFKKSKITCPGCGTAFNPDQLLKSRRGRTAKAATATAATSEEALEQDELLSDDDDADQDDQITEEDGIIPVGTSDSGDDEEAGTLLDDNVDEDFIDEIEDDVTEEDES